MKYLLILNDPPYGTERSYNALRLARSLPKKGGEIGVCGTCIDARGIDQNGLVARVSRSTMDGLTTWTQWADKVVVF